jgi:hypothetical protein
MMWKEFEEIAGYEVSYEDYVNVIEPMYMATSMSKQEFVKCLDAKRFSLKVKKQNLIREMKRIAKERAESCEFFSDYEAEKKLEELSHEYANLFHFHNLKWHEDPSAYCFFNREHWNGLEHGCTYPAELVIGRVGKYGNCDFERIKLVG